MRSIVFGGRALNRDRLCLFRYKRRPFWFCRQSLALCKAAGIGRGNRNYVAASFATLFICVSAVLTGSVGQACAEMAKADGYVVTPNELNKLFIRKHPGPAWLVSHDDVFKFSAAQKGKLEEIGARIAQKTKDDARAVQAAYASFTAAAAKSLADAQAIDGGIESLAKAQVVATRTIVEAYLAAFAVLDPKQKTQLNDLVRCCPPPP